MLNGPAQSYIGTQQYYQLFSNYVLSQHIKLPGGRVIDWIDEDLDADTDEWIAKDMLIAKHKQVGRGNYYNHSGFADPLITGLIGLRPRADSKIVIHPLLARGRVELLCRGRPALSRPSVGDRVRREPASITSAAAALCFLLTAKRSQAAPRSGALEANLPQ